MCELTDEDTVARKDGIIALQDPRRSADEGPVPQHPAEGASMKTLSLALAFVGVGCAICLAEPPAPTFKKIRLTDKFYAEGAYYADFNKDGKLDVVAGPYWYEGPDFQKKHEIHPPKAYDPKGYSDNFLTYTGDFNGDGWPDVLYVPLPRHGRLLVRESRPAKAALGRSIWP